MNSVRIFIIMLLILGILLDAAIVAVLILPIQPPLQVQAPTLEPSIEITIYAKELEGGVFGFGLNPENITSPGPTLKVKVGEVVKITLINLGKIPHALAIVSELKENAPVLFNAEIGNPARPIPPKGSGSVVFKADKTGTYYYICPVPGHAQLGMWGKLVIEEG